MISVFHFSTRRPTVVVVVVLGTLPHHFHYPEGRRLSPRWYSYFVHPISEYFVLVYTIFVLRVCVAATITLTSSLTYIRNLHNSYITTLVIDSTLLRSTLHSIAFPSKRQFEITGY
jgi:hypothetical protein